MEVTEALARKKREILSLWIERTLDSYVAPGFFKTASDPFANPVGSNITAGLTALFDLLLAEADIQAFDKPLDQVVRIRAVQEFTPAQAVAPFLELKWVVKQVLSGDQGFEPLRGKLDVLDCQIDRMALAAFNIYSECREQLYRNRIRELKSGSSILTDAACPSALLRRAQRESSAGLET
ncbi:MAG: RsbRD N-terminal domain-containing protein [Proteobacteria bacterium]|nr:RsbRD N-terminal domain-containing protein [Pseudomonadota bacterium]